MSDPKRWIRHARMDYSDVVQNLGIRFEEAGDGLVKVIATRCSLCSNERELLTLMSWLQFAYDRGAMMFADRLRRIGVEVEDESITVPLRKGDDER